MGKVFVERCYAIFKIPIFGIMKYILRERHTTHKKQNFFKIFCGFFSGLVSIKTNTQNSLKTFRVL